MKIVSKLAAGIALLAGVIASLRVARSTADDIRRYDRLRAMSGDGRLVFQLPAIASGMLAAERKVLPNVAALILSLPSDAVRYARLKAM
jgi:hypothetical protein